MVPPGLGSICLTGVRVMYGGRFISVFRSVPGVSSVLTRVLPVSGRGLYWPSSHRIRRSGPPLSVDILCCGNDSVIHLC